MKEIILKNISFRYEKSIILKDVTFSIEKGNFVIFFGPNGGGKTTLLKIILGFLKADGEISIFGKSPQKIREEIGYVPQVINFDIDFPITVEKMVVLGALQKNKFFLQKSFREKAKKLLEKVGLKEYINAPIKNLSKGQLQRALIARALILDPKILVLDEPISNIDGKNNIFDIFYKLKEKTILMVSHDLKKAALADKIFLVDKQVVSKKKEDLCEHFSAGLFHKPIRKKL